MCVCILQKRQCLINHVKFCKQNPRKPKLSGWKELSIHKFIQMWPAPFFTSESGAWMDGWMMCVKAIQQLDTHQVLVCVQCYESSLEDLQVQQVSWRDNRCVNYLKLKTARREACPQWPSSGQTSTPHWPVRQHQVLTFGVGETLTGR